MDDGVSGEVLFGWYLGIGGVKVWILKNLVREQLMVGFHGG